MSPPARRSADCRGEVYLRWNPWKAGGLFPRILPQNAQTPAASFCSFQPWTGVSDATLQGFHLLALSSVASQALPFRAFFFRFARTCSTLHSLVPLMDPARPERLGQCHLHPVARGYMFYVQKYALPYWAILFHSPVALTVGRTVSLLL